MFKPGSPEWKARIARMLADEEGQPMRWWFLSFAAPGKSLGAVLVEARGPTSALRLTHRLGINPGGQVMTSEVLAEYAARIPESMRHRLCSRKEWESL